MPNTKSAERRMRNSERKRIHNRSISSSLRKTEKSFRVLVTAGKKDEASKALSGVLSAYDKAAKSGVVHKAAADRKKSRLTIALNKLK
jgi:small subunit ribosomal protein S20